MSRKTIGKMMIRSLVLGLMMVFTFAAANADASPVTRLEIYDLADRMLELVRGAELVNDPTAEDSQVEDGVAFVSEYGAVYMDSASLEDGQLNAVMVMDSEVAGPRDVRIDSSVNDIMEAIPSDNEDMEGSEYEALLYLTGSVEEGFSYGRVQRNGQRIISMVYGVTDPETESHVILNLIISGDGVTSMRVEGLNAQFTQAEAEELYASLKKMGEESGYIRVYQDSDGSKLDMFNENDLYCPAINYPSADPNQFGEDVEDALIDNEDGTWFRRIDGDGFEAVFSCDSEGKNATLISFSILSTDLEGPRRVRLGDLYTEVYNRFRHGEGGLDASETVETLYGTIGTAPYGVSEYGNGSEMVLRYVTDTMSGEQVELLLRFEETVLSEITLYTLQN